MFHSRNNSSSNNNDRSNGNKNDGNDNDEGTSNMTISVTMTITITIPIMSRTSRYHKYTAMLIMAMTLMVTSFLDRCYLTVRREPCPISSGGPALCRCGGTASRAQRAWWIPRRLKVTGRSDTSPST